MQQAVEVAQVRNDEMAEATKAAEYQNGLPGESGGNLGPRRAKRCMECNCLASLLSTADRRLGRACSVSAVGCESRTGTAEPPGAAAWRWLVGWLAGLAGWLAGSICARRGVAAAAWRRGGVAAWRVQSPLNPIWPSGNIRP